MKGLRVLGAAAVLTIVLGLLATLGSLVTSNDLLVGSSLGTAALASLVVIVVGVVAFVAVGAPWDDWGRTPYW